ncbi:DUF397 domain-containing protein [Streptomyces sp. NBC_01089]|uniref:DUF397 domain-containing protein n=1 Tax=Streptomyces sp. NBC_01089 TaxID=2903747 RepID=UPI00386D0244
MSTALWRKASDSDGGADNCVDVSLDLPGTAPVRDSKTAPTATATLTSPGAANAPHR